jgi:hypothetical protein
MKAIFPLKLLAFAAFCFSPISSFANSVAREWNEQILAAIRIDFPSPVIHARNLFHTSVVMYDAWAAYDPVAVGWVYNENATAVDVEAAREEAISYAVYRVLKKRFATSVNAVTTLAALDALMLALGYDKDITTKIGDTPAALGNRIASSLLAFGLNDGSNETNGYVDTGGYASMNDPLIVALPGTTMLNPNHWQPLAFEHAYSQNGIPLPNKIQKFLQPHWGDVTAFALAAGPVPRIDPGMPPQLGGEGDAAFKANNIAVIDFSRRLDPDNGIMIDISPGVMGNNTLGLNDGSGRPVNPKTMAGYASNVVKEGDFGRVLAEFWADGPTSETPPGHWNVVANEYVSDSPLLVRKIGGVGPDVSALEWDVKLYLTMNSAVHDAGIAAWNCKLVYDYARPISSIRYMAGLGQSSDAGGPSYHPDGLPLVPGMVEVVTDASNDLGERHEDLEEDKIAIYCWPGEPADPVNDYSGARWILAENWLPYQRDTFVTPAFAGYVSGHSCFSRASAEVLAAFTGDPYFPGGLAEFTALQDDFLGFEKGPSTDVTLQWATYFDASDQSGISRIYGGIHVSPDDGPGRVMGAQCGIASWEMAQRYFDGSIIDVPFTADISLRDDAPVIAWSAVPGYVYQVEASDDGMVSFADISGEVRALSLTGSFTDFSAPESRQYRVRLLREGN